MSLILCLGHIKYRITILGHNKQVFVKVERQLASSWLLSGEKYLPGVRHTNVCVAASEQYILIYDGSIDVIFILNTKLNILSTFRHALNLDLAETSPIRYRSFYLLTERKSVVLFYEQFHKRYNMTHRCMVRGELIYTSTSTLNPVISSKSDIAIPQIRFQHYIETEICNYERTKSAILCNGTIYALIQEPLASKCSIFIYSISKVNEANKNNWELILRDVGHVYFFIYKNQLFGLEFDSYDSVIYHFLPGTPHRTKYVHTEVPLQTEKKTTSIYANNGLICTASDKVLLRLTKFIIV